MITSKVQTAFPALFAGLAALCASVTAEAAHVNMHLVRSAAMNKAIPVTVILPESYDGVRRYPVVYLLHGAGGNHATNTWKGMQELIDRYDVILVSPDGAQTSWWFDSPEDPSFRYETFAAKEVVAWADETFKTMPDRSKRAITGGSMGGHGACYVGIRHKDVFGAIGNVYGGVNLVPFTDRWTIAKRLGEYKDHSERWIEHSVVNQAKTLRNGEVELMTVVGTGDFFLDVNREFHQVLTTNKVAHTYIEVRGEDDAESQHTWETFHRAEKLILSFFREFFDRRTVRFDNPRGEISAAVGEGGRVEIALDEPAGTAWQVAYDELSVHVILRPEAGGGRVTAVVKPFCKGPAVVGLYRLKPGASRDGVRADITLRIQ